MPSVAFLHLEVNNQCEMLIMLLLILVNNFGQFLDAWTARLFIMSNILEIDFLPMQMGPVCKYAKSDLGIRSVA
jgi:hypothetical protein